MSTCGTIVFSSLLNYYPANDWKKYQHVPCEMRTFIDNLRTWFLGQIQSRAVRKHIESDVKSQSSIIMESCVHVPSTDDSPLLLSSLLSSNVIFKDLLTQ